MKRIVAFSVITLILLSLITIAPAPRSLAGDTERVMVQFVPGHGASVRRALERMGGTIHHEFYDLNVIAVTLPGAALEGIGNNPHVVSIEEDAPRYMAGEIVPWGIDHVQAPAMWAEGYDGSGITVCIIDSGLYTGHEDLAGVFASGTDVAGTGNWYEDSCGHGTHVAGTIAATADNDLGVVGVAPGVSLHIVKVFGDDCSWAYSSDLISAANICAANGADIISMSLSGPKMNRREQRTFDSLYSQGILSIAAASNDGATDYAYPASYNSVVSVAALDEANAIADFSQQNDQVELAAPGVHVLSTVPWIATDELTVGGVTYEANHIEFAPDNVTASGALVYGGLCDSTGSWDGNVVLCQRGDIGFYDKVMNVQNSGGAAAVIYNNEPGNFLGTLGEGFTSSIVAISLSQEDGKYLVFNKLDLNADVFSSLSKPDSGYEAWDGTSMATPHVSAVAALLWSSDSSLTNDDIREAMDLSALDLGDLGRDNAFGYGLVQAYDAWQYLGGGSGNTPPVASFTVDCTDLSCDFDAGGSYDPDGYIVSYAWAFGDGGTGSGADVSHAYSADGAYTVTLTVTDNEGASDDDVQTVSVSSGGSGDTMHVSAIEMWSTRQGKNYTVHTEVTIVDELGNPVSDATVSLEMVLASGSIASSPGTTGSDGTVAFSVKSKTTGTYTSKVKGVTHASLTYEPGDNLETSESLEVPLP